ncbi:MOSC domain-containing protein [Pseudochelatococcus sp. B33]
MPARVLALWLAGEAGERASGRESCNTAIVAEAAADPDRALLHYPQFHYTAWQRDLPERADLFVPGAFGENLSADVLGEADVCVGDKVRIGSALLQVTQPFQPNYLLDTRLNHPSVSRKALETLRTGWHYRVLENGSFNLGSALEIIERPHPDWPLSRVLHYFHEETTNRQALEELSALAGLAPAMRKLFRARLNDLEPEFDQLDKLPAPPRIVAAAASASNVPDEEGWIPVLVRGIMIESPAVRSFHLVPAAGGRLPKSKPGAHLKLRLPNRLIRHYSLCNNSSGDEYHIAVGRNPNSAGGSVFLHEQVKVGDVLQIAGPVNTFPVDRKAEHHIMIAGGIGITPFLSMIDHFERLSISYKLHFCTRSEKDTPFYKRLSCLPANRISFHHDGGEPRNGIDLNAVLSDLDPDAHVYCCGPNGLMRAVEGATSHLDRKRVHFESFVSAPATQNAFRVKIESTGQIFPVGPDQTILQVLRDNGINVDSQCEAGSCGTCIVQYSQGDVLHKDFALSPEERKTSLMVCVSRATSDLLTLKL